MNPERLMTETATVTVRTPTGVRDDYGNVLVAGSARTTNCLHQPTEHTENLPIAEQTWDLYLPPGDPLTTTDAVTIDGVQFEVIGPPEPWRHPRTGELEYHKATIRRTDG